MLKVKDNIDLKELEKYGFIYEYDFYKNYEGDGKPIHWWNDGRDLEKYKNYYFGDGKYTNEIYLHEKDRIIHNINCDEMCNDYDEEFLDVLYDLIKDGLVEKISLEVVYD